MRVIKRTESQLIVGSSWIGMALFGSAFLLAGIKLIIDLKVIPMGILFVCVGMFVIIKSKGWKITASRAMRTLTLQISSIASKTNRTIPYAEINSFILEQFVYININATGPRSQQDLNFIMQLQNGERILLNAGSSGNTYVMGVQLQNGLMGTQGKTYKVAKELADYIGVPLVDNRAKDIAQGIKQYTERIATRTADQ